MEQNEPLLVPEQNKEVGIDQNEPLLVLEQDKEVGLDQNEADLEKQIKREMRLGFITKVYMILLTQILITGFFIILSQTSKTYAESILSSAFLFWFSVITLFVIVFLPLCIPNIFRKVPVNYILLLIFTLCMSHLVAMSTAGCDSATVLEAAFATFACVLSLTIYAWKTDKDFTFCGGLLSSLLGTLILVEIFNLFFRVEFIRRICIYSSLLIFSAYIIYDTQLIVGKKRIQLSEDDYILGALSLYLDIINIFLKFLSLFGRRH